MVAPQRAPHARGLKCELCKTILAEMTWLDQTKPAKTLAQAQNVLHLMAQHDHRQCPCIPADIRYLFIGSTHFELHRLETRMLDDNVNQWQQSQLLLTYKSKLANSKTRKLNSDCKEYLGSRFKCGFPPQMDFIVSNNNDNNNGDNAEQYKQTIEHNMVDGRGDEPQEETPRIPSCLIHVKHLQSAIDYWHEAISDQQVAFNSKLALRLGLTHHVIYSCYLFKYLKILNYQLKSADLLVNLFQVVPAVTPNAIVHANYLLIRTLLDMGFVNAAKNLLKSATKLKTADDLTHYESILLLNLECELELIDRTAASTDRDSILIRLEEVIHVKKDDKLQHYYARTIARYSLIKYLRYHKNRSVLGNDFFFINRYLGAMMRRCYDSSFRTKPTEGNKDTDSIDHKWIRCAVCDLAFTCFEYIAKFYAKFGMPEQLELIFNGLYNVACRNASVYWVFKLILVAIDFDYLCDKGKDLGEKMLMLDSIRKSRATTMPDEMNLFWDILILERKITKLSISHRTQIKSVLDSLEKLKKELSGLGEKLYNFVSEYQLLRYPTKSKVKISSFGDNSCEESTMMVNEIRKCILTSIKAQLIVLKNCGRHFESRSLFRQCLEMISTYVIEHQEDMILGSMLMIVTKCDTDTSNYLLKSVRSSQNFFHYSGVLSDQTKQKQSKQQLTALDNLEFKTSKLSLNDDVSRLSQSSATETSRSMPDLRMRTLSCRLGKITSKVIKSTKQDCNLSAPYLRDILTSMDNPRQLDAELIKLYFTLVLDFPDFHEYRSLNEYIFAHRLGLGLIDDVTMYHLFESNSANCLRYRWMMYQEQYSKKPTSLDKSNQDLISFSGANLVNDRCYSKFLRSIPAGWRLVNLQYTVDESDDTEHLIVSRIECDSDPILIHLERNIETDCFSSIDKQSVMNGNQAPRTILEKLRHYISRASQSLSWSNYSSRSECRKSIEGDMTLLLDDIESDLFGPFKWLLIGKVIETDYQNTIINLADQLMEQLSSLTEIAATVNSKALLVAFLEGAPLLSREEFCLGFSALFCSAAKTKNVAHECFKLWTKAIEGFIKDKYPGYNKSTLLSGLPKSQIGLILNDHSQEIPFESLPAIRISRQPIFRVPSLRMFHFLRNNLEAKLDDRSEYLIADSSKLSYILDPENNLNRTKGRFQDKLQSVSTWTGVVGKPPNLERLESWLTTRDIYLFIGHGAGTTYYNQLSAGHGLTSLDVVPIAVVMGCSSGRLLSEGGRLERHGIAWNFILRGSPSYIGLLWDVTDTDIDKFFDSMMSKWTNLWGANDVKCKQLSSTEAVASSRHVCQSSCLVGSAPVVYGLPVILNHDKK